MTPDILARIRRGLAGPLPGLEAHRLLSPRVLDGSPPPPTAMQSGVMALLHGYGDALRLTLIQRTEDAGAHSRQIAFPGGRAEPEDESLLRTAQRETLEELGVPSETYEVLGALSPLYIPVSGFVVQPFLAHAPSPPVYVPAPDEVAQVLEIPLEYLAAEGCFTTAEVMPSGGGALRTAPAYLLPGGLILWGATAMVVAEILALANQG